jgi:2'-5' RNA ligase
MASAKGYSLWLMPSGDAYNRLNSIMSGLCRKHSSPFFEPHITLMGEVTGPKQEVISGTKRLVEKTRPFTVRLNRIGYFDEYFRCLFIQAEKTDELMKANLMARQEFSRQDDPEYFPHLSLMYGDFPEKAKQDIIREIGKELRISFNVESIHIFSTRGGARDWHRVREFPLIGSSR